MPAPARPARRRDIAWTGLIGSLLGILFPSQAAVYIIAFDDTSALWALPLLAIAALYVPAAWVSFFPSPNRQKVQKRVLGVTLAVVVLGVLFVDAALATLLIVPSTLLAIASGVVFQPKRKA